MRFAFALPFIAVGGLCAADPVVAPSTATIKIRYNNATIVSSISASVATTNGSIWMPPRTRSQFGYSYNGSTKADGVMRLTGGTIVGQDLVKLVPVYSSGVSTPITMIPGGEYAPACGRQEFTSTNLVGFMDWWIRNTSGVIVKKTHGTACAANFAGMLSPTATASAISGGKRDVFFGYTASWPSYITYPVAAENNIVTIGNTVVICSKPTNFLSGTRPAVFKVTISINQTIKWEIAGKSVVVKGSTGLATNQ